MSVIVIVSPIREATGGNVADIHIRARSKRLFVNGFLRLFAV